MIFVDPEGMPVKIREKMTKALDQVARIGRQANRVSPRSYRVLKDTGLERIYKWALPDLHPAHKDRFCQSIGEVICRLLLNTNCRNCPVRRYKANLPTCHRKLGEWALAQEEEHGNNRKGCSQNRL
jgi:hypothetical protein